MHPNRTTDALMMDRALALAHAQLGRTAPNPSVGCVIAIGAAILGEGATGAGGRPHAEAVALSIAGDRARGATAYVTLEPCHHPSPRGPACGPGLIAAGIARVVVAVEDPDPRMAGGSLAALRDAGVIVELGLGAATARAQHTGFFRRIRDGMAWIGVDPSPALYERSLTDDPGLDPADLARNLAQEGLSRVHVAPGTPFAERLLRAGVAQLARDGLPL
jgi:diaminohydroxyphosphoribosylaminopyrimidine deaminase/5-amino-6-(5-phosphoribosylamino)uracil reductase